MHPNAALFLIADDDREHVEFLREQISATSLHLSVHAENAGEATMYLESLALHNPTGRPVPCVLLLGFSDEDEKLEVLNWLAVHSAARPRSTSVMSWPATAHDRERFLALGADEVCSRFPTAADIARLAEHHAPVA